MNIHIQSLNRYTLPFFLAITLRSPFVQRSFIVQFLSLISKQNEERTRKGERKFTFHFRNIILIRIFKFKKFKNNILKHVRRYTYKNICISFVLLLFSLWLHQSRLMTRRYIFWLMLLVLKHLHVSMNYFFLKTSSCLGWERITCYINV